MNIKFICLTHAVGALHVQTFTPSPNGFEEPEVYAI